MPMNLVIQQKRKELGLTQEQVAKYLNVSIPAVSKWEKGSTSPDISLLAPLARLLKVDLNTLFCFQEDISEQEMGCVCRGIMEIAQKEGVASAFGAAKQKIHEYPHNEALLQCLTFQLDGLLAISGLPDHEVRCYDDMLAQWYHKLAGSSDGKISNSASYMMVSRFIRNGEYGKAQEVLDSMPDKEDAFSSMADKQMLQTNIYLCQGETEKAIKGLQNALLLALNKVQMLLYKMVDAQLADGSVQAAKDVADIASQMPGLFGLWEYNSFVAPLQVAGAKKDAGECICLLRKLLETMRTPWDMGNSPLFNRIAKVSDPKQMLPAILLELERDAAYDFLRDHSEFKELVSEYKAWVESEIIP